MPDLSACYFCGTALDEPLSEYPVVPGTLQPAADQQRTVVLCSSCRRKLDRVVDAVLDAVDDHPLDDTVQQGLSATGSAGAATVDDPDERTDTVADDADASERPGDEWTSPEVAVENEAADGPGDDEAATAGASPTGTSTEMDSDTTPPPDTGSGDESSTSAPDDPPVPSSDDPSTSVPDDPPASVEDDSTASTKGTETTPGDGDEADPNLTALEYTKVMRLLENRELPVDREELRVVATNAYEIRPQEFDAIVDTAIERGLLVEDDGQFVAIE